MKTCNLEEAAAAICGVHGKVSMKTKATISSKMVKLV
jgi:hypothetical protein